MSVVGLTREASEHRDVDQTLSGHLCRCTSYTQIKAAVERVLNTAGAAGEV
jgi:aerobic-type carbon monoxide dehydrogenase small subunit (CoxS/CutS family)